jgi:predicted ATPase with chaperone activity
MLAAKPDVPSILPHPPAPDTLEEAGLTLDLLVQLTLKTLHFTGELTGAELAQRMGLKFSVIEPAIVTIKSQHQVEVVGGAMIGGPSYRYRITDAGRTRAQLFLETNHYVGAAPVPLAQYKRYMTAFKVKAPRIATRDRVRQAFSHLVISDRVMDQLGPAINAGHSMFVYGPPGNGKTVISQAIQKLLDGDLHIPHALEVEGAIIRILDPVTHEELPDEQPELPGLDKGQNLDRRWVRCRRPMVMVGGELTLDSLELSYNPSAGFYKAPVQAVANGGVLVIDDFGRQRVPARDLLNRWIVPLESRVDFLTLNTGQKFELPFMTLVAFATNIRPQELVDEAFLRRIHYKVLCESPNSEDYIVIFRNYCRTMNVPFKRELVEDLLENYYKPRHLPLRGCHPRDLIEQSLSLAEYLGKPPELTPELVRAACDSYFVDESGEEMSTLLPPA